MFLPSFFSAFILKNPRFLQSYLFHVDLFPEEATFWMHQLNFDQSTAIGLENYYVTYDPENLFIYLDPKSGVHD